MSHRSPEFVGVPFGESFSSNPEKGTCKTDIPWPCLKSGDPRTTPAFFLDGSDHLLGVPNFESRCPKCVLSHNPGIWSASNQPNTPNKQPKKENKGKLKSNCHMNPWVHLSFTSSSRASEIVSSLRRVFFFFPAEPSSRTSAPASWPGSPGEENTPGFGWRGAPAIGALFIAVSLFFGGRVPLLK